MEFVNTTPRTQCLDIYLSEIKRNKSLDRTTETELFSRVRMGDKKAETEIFNRVSRFAVAMAKTYTGKPDLLQDLIQEAGIGILTAIHKFEPGGPMSFVSYARYWMRLMICNFLGDVEIIHTKNATLERKVKAVRREFYQEYGRDPQEWEVMDILESKGVVVKDISAIQELCQIELEFTDEDGDRTESTVVSAATCQRNEYEDEMEKESIDYEVRKKLMKLTDRERKMVMMKFGLGGYPEMDYDAIAQRMTDETGKEMGSERARQIVTGAIKKMK